MKIEKDAAVENVAVEDEERRKFRTNTRDKTVQLEKTIIEDRRKLKEDSDLEEHEPVDLQKA